MAKKMILIDTSVLIDFYRKTNKANSIWISLVQQGYSFAISVITKYEIYAGATPAQLEFWGSIFNMLTIIPLDEGSVNTAVEINADLRRKRKQIDLADLLIAATAIANDLSIATLNQKHFERIDKLIVVS